MGENWPFDSEFLWRTEEIALSNFQNPVLPYSSGFWSL